MSAFVAIDGKNSTHLAQSARLEAVGQLANGIAHDFNNLITIIAGFAKFAADEVGAESPAQEDLQVVLQTAQRASALVRQLLAFSRKEVLAPGVVDLNELLVGLDRMLRRVLGEDISVVTLPEARAAQVWAGGGQLEQIILNLALNARDAMPRGGRLTLRTESMGDRVRLHVTDEGTGMDPAICARVFEPFFTTKDRGRGSGLGLAMCQSVARALDGELEVASSPGEGTTFTLSLPLAHERAAAPVPCSVPPPGRSGTILLVEDEPAVRRFAQRVLERNGYEVLLAADGEEALVWVARHTGPIDLVVTDVVMPHLGGRELARRLARVRPGTPVLLASGYDVERGTPGDDLPFLPKPYTPSELLAAVSDQLTPVERAAERPRASTRPAYYAVRVRPPDSLASAVARGWQSPFGA